MKKDFSTYFGLSLSVGVLSLFSAFGHCCTTVFANDKGATLAVARTMDLYISDTPLIKATPRGAKRTGETEQNTLTWTSKYGNVVVTAFHTPTASDGLNEKGLAVHLLYLTSTKYPMADNTKPSISNALWAQYILDNFTTVKDALEGTKTLQIIATKVHDKIWPIHLAMEDTTGDSAIVEFIDGKMHIYHGANYQVMTNEPPYNVQLANLKRYQGFGGKLSLPGDTDPLSRFVRVATFLKTLPAATNELEALAGVLSVIRTAMVPFGAVDTSGNKTVDAWPTRWVTLADVTHNTFYFNSTSAPNLIWLDLNKINFAEGAPVLSIDPTDIHLEGDITKKLVPDTTH